MKILKTQVYGFQMALEGMRNPMNSWAKSDSKFWSDPDPPSTCPEYPLLGPKDLSLACKLIKGGSEHRKFLRQICVWVVWVLPRYLYTEVDTYKIATVRNSCSTMHKLGSEDLTPEDFQDEDVLPEVLHHLNCAASALRTHQLWTPPYRTEPLQGEEIKRWMKKHLPEGFLQKATMTFNYETLLSMYGQRKNHRLPEWSGDNPLILQSICEWIEYLPYMKEFIKAVEER